MRTPPFLWLLHRHQQLRPPPGLNDGRSTGGPRVAKVAADTRRRIEDRVFEKRSLTARSLSAGGSGPRAGGRRCRQKRRRNIEKSRRSRNARTISIKPVISASNSISDTGWPSISRRRINRGV